MEITKLLKTIEDLRTEIQAEYDLKLASLREEQKKLATQLELVAAFEAEKKEVEELKAQIDADKALIAAEKEESHNRKIALEQKEKVIKEKSQQLQTLLNQ